MCLSVCVFWWCDVFPVYPGGAQAKGAGEERPVGPGEWQDTEADAGVAGQHRPPPHCIHSWPHWCPADTTGGSGTHQCVYVCLSGMKRTKGRLLFLNYFHYQIRLAHSCLVVFYKWHWLLFTHKKTKYFLCTSICTNSPQLSENCYWALISLCWIIIY